MTPTLRKQRGAHVYKNTHVHTGTDTHTHTCMHTHVHTATRLPSSIYTEQDPSQRTVPFTVGGSYPPQLA